MSDPCMVSDCDRAKSGKQPYCKMHAERVRRNGHPDLMEKPPPHLCECGCGERARRRYLLGHRNSFVLATTILSETADGCWEWLGRTDRDGYGVTKVRGRQVATYRLMWERDRGPVPTGLELDHLCRNRLCVNPGHLEAVTHRTNVLRGASPPAVHAQKTHCKNGHPFSGPSEAGKVRVCRPCQAAAQRRCQERKRARAS